MLNSIITGISQKLDQEFNNENKYTIYSEHKKQGFKEPCFFIMNLNNSQEKLISTRYRKLYSFDIHYFAEDTINVNNELNRVMEKLYNALEYITVDEDLVRSLKMRAETIDNVLHFFIDFNIHVFKLLGQDEMEDLEIIQNVG